MSQETDTKLDLICEARVQLNADMAAVTMVCDDGENFVHVVGMPNATNPEVFKEPFDKTSLAARVIHTAAAVIINEMSAPTNEYHCPMMKAEKLEGYLALPVHAEGRCIGAVELMTRKPRQWNDIDVTQLAAIAEKIQLSLGSENQSSFAEVRRSQAA